MKPDDKPLNSVRQLKCLLNDDERGHRLRELLDLEDRLDTLADELAAVKAQHKLKVGDAETRLRVLRKALRSGEEEREVRCSSAPDWEARKMVTTRDDTSAVVDARPLTDHELQGRLQLVNVEEGEPVDPAVERAERHLAGEESPPVEHKPAAAGGEFPPGTLTRDELMNLPAGDKPKGKRRKA